MKKKYHAFIGRYQPLHGGHKKLINVVLKEGKNVLVLLKDTGKNEKNPYSVEERIDMFNGAFPKEIKKGRLKIKAIENVECICYGRKVGWDIRKIKLDEETEKISATKIRKEKDKK